MEHPETCQPNGTVGEYDIKRYRLFTLVVFRYNEYKMGVFT